MYSINSTKTLFKVPRFNDFFSPSVFKIMNERMNESLNNILKKRAMMLLILKIPFEIINKNQIKYKLTK